MGHRFRSLQSGKHEEKDDARAFYEAVGFLPSPSDPMMLMVGLRDLNNALNS